MLRKREEEEQVRSGNDEIAIEMMATFGVDKRKIVY